MKLKEIISGRIEAIISSFTCFEILDEVVCNGVSDEGVVGAALIVKS